MRRPRVAVIRTQPETVREDTLRALRLVQGRRPASARGTVLAFEAGRRPGVASVPPWTLDVALEVSRGASTGRTVAVGIGAGRTGVEALDRVLAHAGAVAHASVAEGTDRVDLDLPWLRGRRGREVTVDVESRGRDLLWSGGLVHDRVHAVRGAVEGTLALVARPDEIEDRDPQTWSELFRLVEATFADRIHVLDATVCHGSEPGTRPQVHNLVLAGRDPLALDAIAARLLGYDLNRVLWLRALAESLRRDVTPGAIELVGGVTGAAGEDDWVRAGGRAPARGRPRPEWVRRLRPLAPARLAARWRDRQWRRLYERTPWGRLEQDYRRAGRPGSKASA